MRLVVQREELDQQAESLRKEREEWEAERAEDESPQKAVSSEAPVSLESVLGKLGVDIPIEDDQPEVPPPSTFNTSTSNTSTSVNAEQMGTAPESNIFAPNISETVVPETVASKRVADDSHGEEESIDSYMSRLLDRVRSVNGAELATSGTKKDEHVNVPTPVVPDSAPRQEKPQAEISQPATPQPVQSAVGPEEQATDAEKLKDLSPRGVAPEQPMSLSAMRELANVSAQSAISRHTKRQFRHVARSKLLVAGIGLAAGSILMYLWWFMGNRGPVFYAGLLAFLVALIWGFQFSTMSGKWATTKASAKRIAGMPAMGKKESVSDDLEPPQR